MTRWLDTYAAYLLSLILVVTSLGAAHARGMPGPDGALVICTGNGPVVVLYDADGSPASEPYICPDGALSLIQSNLDQPTDLQRCDIVRQVAFFDACVCAEDSAKPIAHSRDPPSFA